MTRFFEASIVARQAFGFAAFLSGAIVVAVFTGAVKFNELVLDDKVYAAVTLVAVSCATVLVALWRYSTDRFPQWLKDDPRLDAELGQPPDRYNTTPWAEGLQLTVKNRPWHTRKTRTARDARLFAIFDSGSHGGAFEPQLVWDTGQKRPERVINLAAKDRAYIPIATKSYVGPERRNGSEYRNKYAGVLRHGVTYLMDEQYHQEKPRILEPTQYNIAIWIEYDGGHKTRRRYFSLLVDKDLARRNDLRRSDWE